MVLTAHTPFDTQMARLLCDAVRTVGPPRRTWVPSCNAWEDADRFCVELALPNWQAQHVKIGVENGMLTVEGKKQDDEASGNGNART